MACDLCKDNPGWRDVVDGAGVHRMAPCPCVSKSEIGNLKLGGFEKLGDGVPRLIKELNPVARAIAQILLEHRGERNAIKIDDLRLQVPVVGDAERSIKQAVSDLVLFGKMMIASSRDPKHPGYYLIETAEELDRARSETLKHLRAWARRFKALDPDGSASREIYGQLREDLQNSEL